MTFPNHWCHGPLRQELQGLRKLALAKASAVSQSTPDKVTKKQRVATGDDSQRELFKVGPNEHFWFSTVFKKIRSFFYITPVIPSVSFHNPCQGGPFSGKWRLSG